MRVVGGKFKARRFEAPKHIKARPTTDMAKEAIFNVLNHHDMLMDAVVLDLFFGIGGISPRHVDGCCGTRLVLRHRWNEP